MILPSARARSPTCCTRPPATRPTTSTTARGSSPTRSRPAPSASVQRAGTAWWSRTSASRPPFATEGQAEAMEFADGNYGLLEGALAYSQGHHAAGRSTSSTAADRRRPTARSTTGSPGPDEAAVIHYTTDGSTPTLASPTYENQGPRRPGQVLTLDRPGAHAVKWIAVDIKGNVSAVQSQTFLIGPEADGQRHGAGDAVALASARRRRSARSRRASTATTTTTMAANVISTAGDAALSVADPARPPPAVWSTARSRCRRRCRSRRPASRPAPAARSRRCRRRPARRCRCSATAGRRPTTR